MIFCFSSNILKFSCILPVKISKKYFVLHPVSIFCFILHSTKPLLDLLFSFSNLSMFSCQTCFFLVSSTFVFFLYSLSCKSLDLMPTHTYDPISHGSPHIAFTNTFQNIYKLEPIEVKKDSYRWWSTFFSSSIFKV